MKFVLPALAVCALVTASAVTVSASSDGGWLRSVPNSARLRANPLSGDSEAPQAGARLYRRSCSSCHAADASGRGSKPSLRSLRVHNATDGELEWLLRNGNLAQGMPSWSRLPEAQRWQIVTYLHTLPTE